MVEEQTLLEFNIQADHSTVCTTNLSKSFKLLQFKLQYTKSCVKFLCSTHYFDISYRRNLCFNMHTSKTWINQRFQTKLWYHNWGPNWPRIFRSLLERDYSIQMDTGHYNNGIHDWLLFLSDYFLPSYISDDSSLYYCRKTLRIKISKQGLTIQRDNGLNICVPNDYIYWLLFNQSL